MDYKIATQNWTIKLQLKIATQNCNSKLDYKIATQNWTIKLQLKIELKANCKSKIKIVATIKLEVEVVLPIKIELKVGANAKQNLKHDIKIRNYFVYTYTKFDFCPQWLSIPMESHCGQKSNFVYVYTK